MPGSTVSDNSIKRIIYNQRFLSYIFLHWMIGHSNLTLINRKLSMILPLLAST